MVGFEPTAPCSQGTCSNLAELHPVVGVAGFEPATSRSRSVRACQTAPNAVG